MANAVNTNTCRAVGMIAVILILRALLCACEDKTMVTEILVLHEQRYGDVLVFKMDGQFVTRIHLYIQSKNNNGRKKGQISSVNCL